MVLTIIQDRILVLKAGLNGQASAKPAIHLVNLDQLQLIHQWTFTGCHTRPRFPVSQSHELDQQGIMILKAESSSNLTRRQ